jgi:hypothetical protein
MFFGRAFLFLLMLFLVLLVIRLVRGAGRR